MIKKFNFFILLFLCLLSTSLFAMKRDFSNTKDKKIVVSIKDVPIEILPQIFYFIENNHQSNTGYSLRDVRLVCRLWNKLIMNSDYLAPTIPCVAWNFKEVKNLLDNYPVKSLSIIYQESTNIQRNKYEKFIKYINKKSKYTDGQKRIFNDFFIRCNCVYDYDYECCGLNFSYLNYKNFFVRIHVLEKVYHTSLDEIYEQIMDDFLENNFEENKFDEKLYNAWCTQEMQKTKKLLQDPYALAILFPDPSTRPATLTVDNAFEDIGQRELVFMTDKLLNYRDLLELKIKIKGKYEDPKIIPQNIFASLEKNQPAKIFEQLKKLSLTVPTIKNSSIEKLISYIPNLTELNLKNSSVDDEVINILSVAINSKKLNHLKVLNLVDTNVSSNNVFFLLNKLQKLSVDGDCLIAQRQPMIILDLLGVQYNSIEKEWTKAEQLRPKKLIIDIKNNSNLYQTYLLVARKNEAAARSQLIETMAFLKRNCSLKQKDLDIEFYLHKQRIFPELYILIGYEVGKEWILRQAQSKAGRRSGPIKINLRSWPMDKATNEYLRQLQVQYSDCKINLEYTNVDEKSFSSIEY